MKLKEIINEYTESNISEVKIVDNKIHIYYYKTIKSFSNSKIVIIIDHSTYFIEGKNLSIDSMNKEELVISGTINSINMEHYND